MTRRRRKKSGSTPQGEGNRPKSKKKKNFRSKNRDEAKPKGEGRNRGRRGPQGGSEKRKNPYDFSQLSRSRARGEEAPASAPGKRNPGQEKGIRRIRARVDKARSGAAFLMLDKKGSDDIFVPPRDARNLFPGDRVELILGPTDEVLGLRVIHRRFRELVGRYHTDGSGQAAWVTYQRKRMQEDIPVPKPPAQTRDGDWVLARLLSGGRDGQSINAEIVDTFGPDLPPEADIRAVSGEYNLQEEHSPEAKAEARAFRLEVPGKDEKGRTDLRNIPFITIDGETARDFDDAVYVDQQKNGFVLWVAIADVSHYVKPDTILDREAFERATSVYFPERAFHMLPRELSENLCSLRPHEPRLALAAEIHFSPAGEKTKIKLHDAIIESRRRATYTEIQHEADKNRDNPDWEYRPHYNLFEILRKNRLSRGSIDFDLPEAQVLVDERGDPVDIQIRERWDAHKLIEEFMIAANESVTEWMLQKKWPFMYRVHEEPAEQSILKFFSLCNAMGIDIGYGQGAKKDAKPAGRGQSRGRGRGRDRGRDPRNEKSQDAQPKAPSIAPKDIAVIIKKFKGHEAEFLLNLSLLRSMKQAVYTSVHNIHFGLASRAYTHFTSPIRRYPDLIVHRLLHRALHAESDPKLKLHADESQALETELEEQAEHCSYRERLASEAERESIRLKQVRIMAKHIGEQFDGSVIGMTERGFFVQVRQPYAEGFVSRESLKDDFYILNEDLMLFQGSRTRRLFKIGTPVRIQVAKADLDSRMIDFELVDTGPSR